MPPPPFAIAIVPGPAGARQARPVRHRVFVHEQRIPPELEWDAADDEAWHALARSAEGAVIGTARLLPSAQIGRMAVLAQWRRQGVGSALLHALLAQAERAGMEAVFLHAQSSAEAFYARHGFVPAGASFMEAGIEHRYMRRPCRRSGR